MNTIILIAGVGIGVMFAEVSNGTSHLGLLATLMLIVLVTGTVIIDIDSHGK
jgi:hypothetical protein